MAQGPPRVHIIYRSVSSVTRAPRSPDFLDSLSVSSLGWPAAATDSHIGDITPRRTNALARPTPPARTTAGRYADRSPLTVFSHTKLNRAYDIFRKLGMRHLVVVNSVSAWLTTRPPTMA